MDTKIINSANVSSATINNKTAQDRKEALAEIMAKHNANALGVPVEKCHSAELTQDGFFVVKIDIVKALKNTKASASGKSKYYSVNEMIIGKDVRLVGNVLVLK